MIKPTIAQSAFERRDRCIVMIRKHRLTTSMELAGREGSCHLLRREVLPPIGNQEGGEQTLIAENVQPQSFALSSTITASGA
jgi:hypothetical protein